MTIFGMHMTVSHHLPVW